MTREQKYTEQLKALGVYDPIFGPEIKCLSRLEKELQRAQKEWSATANPPGSRPSFLDPHYAIIQKLNTDILRHREALGMTPMAMRKLKGVQAEGPDTRELIAEKLDRIADSVAGYDVPQASDGEDIDVAKLIGVRDAFAGMAGFEEAAAISDQMDEEDYDLKQAVAEDMG